MKKRPQNQHGVLTCCVQGTMSGVLCHLHKSICKGGIIIQTRQMRKAGLPEHKIPFFRSRDEEVTAAPFEPEPPGLEHLLRASLVPWQLPSEVPRCVPVRQEGPGDMATQYVTGPFLGRSPALTAPRWPLHR